MNHLVRILQVRWTSAVMRFAHWLLKVVDRYQPRSLWEAEKRNPQPGDWKVSGHTLFVCTGKTGRFIDLVDAKAVYLEGGEVAKTT